MQSVAPAMLKMMGVHSSLSVIVSSSHCEAKYGNIGPGFKSLVVGLANSLSFEASPIFEEYT